MRFENRCVLLERTERLDDWRSDEKADLMLLEWKHLRAERCIVWWMGYFRIEHCYMSCFEGINLLYQVYVTLSERSINRIKLKAAQNIFLCRLSISYNLSNNCHQIGPKCLPFTVGRKIILQHHSFPLIFHQISSKEPHPKLAGSNESHYERGT